MSQPRRMWIVWLWVALALIVLSTVSVSVAEERNAFCASCHLRPEQTYVDRSRVKARGDAADLASAHAAAGVNCVGCHRGDQAMRDRATALALGARNTEKFIAGQYDPNHSQVALPWLLDDSCLRCHVTQPTLGSVKSGQLNPVTVGGFENHFHTLLLDLQVKTSVTGDYLQLRGVLNLLRQWPEQVRESDKMWGNPQKCDLHKLPPGSPGNIPRIAVPRSEQGGAACV